MALNAVQNLIKGFQPFENKNGIKCCRKSCHEGFSARRVFSMNNEISTI